MRFITFFIILLTAFSFTGIERLSDDPKVILKRSEDVVRGTNNFAELSMTIVRPEWTREMTMKSWAMGEKLSLILITSPARDKGISFLKRDKELWNWQPSIDRVVKMPPSMMMQSWMGSDFTNDDLVHQSSLIDDYDHQMLENAEVDGRD